MADVRTFLREMETVAHGERMCRSVELGKASVADTQSAVIIATPQFTLPAEVV